MSLQSIKTIADICAPKRYQDKCLTDGYCRTGIGTEALLKLVFLYFFNRIWTNDGYFMATVPFFMGDKDGFTSIGIPYTNVKFRLNIPYIQCPFTTSIRIEPADKSICSQYHLDRNWYHQCGEYQYGIEIEADNNFGRNNSFKMKEIEDYDPSTNDSVAKLVLSEPYSFELIYEFHTSSTKGLTGGITTACMPPTICQGRVNLIDYITFHVFNRSTSPEPRSETTPETTPEPIYFDINKKLFITVAVKISPVTPKEDMFEYALFVGFEADEAIAIADALPNPCSLCREFNKYEWDQQYEYLSKKLSVIKCELSFNRLYAFIVRFNDYFDFNADCTSYKINLS